MTLAAEGAFGRQERGLQKEVLASLGQPLNRGCRMFGQFRVQKLINPVCDLERWWIEVAGWPEKAGRGLPSNTETDFPFKAPGHSSPSGCDT